MACVSLLLVTTIALLLPPANAQTLYRQSLQTALTRTTPGLELLLLDPRTREPLADTFAAPGAPIPTGSLLKPFLAVAYARTHATFPKYRCPSHTEPLTLPQALAESCNAYFLALAAQIDPATLHDLPAPHSLAPHTLIGLTPDWPIAPLALARAYAALLLSPQTPRPILEGMRLAAHTGTASGLGPLPAGALAKTGTAPCVPAPAHPCRANGDGLVLIAVPAAHPTLLLLVRKPATTGAATAAAARSILAQLKALHAY